MIEEKKPINNTVSTNDLFDFDERDDGDIDLSIIIPVFNNVNFTQLALDGLINLPSNYEIIIFQETGCSGRNAAANEICRSFPGYLRRTASG